MLLLQSCFTCPVIYNRWKPIFFKKFFLFYAFLYSLKAKSNYQRWQIIFCSRSWSKQILNAMILFLKTRAFNVSLEAEKRGTRKLLNSKKIRRLDTTGVRFFFLRVLVSLTNSFHFFLFSEGSLFIGKIFFRRTEAVA